MGLTMTKYASIIDIHIVFQLVPHRQEIANGSI
jgi:hypothetical protein